MMKKKLFGSILILLVIACKENKKLVEDVSRRGLITNEAMVVSARAEASKIGSDILQKGGNAFDAMIATELALAVAYPVAGNISGGGFMVYRKKDGSTGAIDYREKAPQGASKDMYLDKEGNVIKNLSTHGALAVGVPGTVAGVLEVHKKLGSLSLEDIINPVIELARKGVVVTKKQESRIRWSQKVFRQVNKDSIVFMKAWKKGDTIKNPTIAETLERILKEGKDGFYKGKTAKIFAKFIQENGGIITEKDMANYDAVWRKPVTFTYDNLKIISMAPPSSGGICMGQIMNMVEPYDLDKYGHNTLKTIQVITEAERRAYADRSYYMGDPDFVNVPVKELMEANYLKDRMSNFSFDKPTLSSELSYGKVQFQESEETTHYSIIDQFGNAISATTTLNAGFGSKLYCSELGFFMNNIMDDFSIKPGVPNIFGLVGGEANSIAPEKRMLSSMSPTIVEKDGELWMSVGTPGGSTIITSVVQTILNVHEYKMTMQEAVNAPRFHHQWLPDLIRFEPKSFSKELLDSVTTKGYKILKKNSKVIGKVDGIMLLPNGKLEGGADRRGDDTAIGF